MSPTKSFLNMRVAEVPEALLQVATPRQGRVGILPMCLFKIMFCWIYPMMIKNVAVLSGFFYCSVASFL
jgi:hypothetical protein